MVVFHSVTLIPKHTSVSTQKWFSDHIIKQWHPGLTLLFRSSESANEVSERFSEYSEELSKTCLICILSAF